MPPNLERALMLETFRIERIYENLICFGNNEVPVVGIWVKMTLDRG